MKRHLVLLSLLIIGLSSCKKIDTASQAATQTPIDDAKIQAFIKANNINATKDPSGLYYEIVTPGTDTIPTTISTVKLSYTYSYLNGVSLGQVDGVTARLSSFIAGIRIGVLKIGNHGRIKLIIPTGLANGYTDQDGIPANSTLFYTIDLNGISN